MTATLNRPGPSKVKSDINSQTLSNPIRIIWGNESYFSRNVYSRETERTYLIGKNISTFFARLVGYASAAGFCLAILKFKASFLINCRTFEAVLFSLLHHDSLWFLEESLWFLNQSSVFCFDSLWSLIWVLICLLKVSTGSIEYAEETRSFWVQRET